MRSFRIGLTAAVAAVVTQSGAAHGFGSTPVPLCLGEPVTISATPGAPVIGTAGPDVIAGTSGPDVINARGGWDLVCGRGGGDVIRGGRGEDDLRGGPGRDTLSGNRGVDLVYGDSGRDLVYGGKAEEDNVQLIGDGDTLHRGYADYGEAPRGVTVDLALGSGQLKGGDRRDRFIKVRDVGGSEFADVLLGDDEQNQLLGGAGNDLLAGRAGMDYLAGYSGDDRMFGGSGSDYLEGFRGDDRMNAGSGVDYCVGNRGREIRISCEYDFAP